MAMRKPIHLRYVEDPPKNEGGNGGNEGGGGSGSGKEHEHGFPKDTPLAEMKVEEREAYWKYHARKHEGVANSRADYDQQKADAEKWRQAQRENLKPDERALEDAKAEARREERNKIAPRLVKAEFKALGKDVPEELLTAFLDDLNHEKYLGTDGEVDTEKVKARVAVLTPKQQQQQRRDNHQGFRRTDGATSVSAGRDMYASRNKKG